MALIPAFHETYGWCVVPEGKVRLHPDDWSTYDPSKHKADDVVAYLLTVGPRERDRVLAAERASKRPRKTVLAVADQELHDDDPDTSVDEAFLTQLAAAAGAGDTTPTGPAPDAPTED